MLVYTEQVYQLIDSLQIFSIVSYNTAQEKKIVLKWVFGSVEK